MSTHQHGHDHTEDVDWDSLAATLEREAELHTPFLDGAARWVRDLLGGGPDAPGVRRVLDLGSGPGVATCLLARRFPQAEVVAVDSGPRLLERARERAGEQGVAERVRTVRADLPQDLATLGTADVIWTSNVVHHLGDQQAALDAMARLLRPGGVLAVVERGLSPRCLPRDIGMGRPGLQSRLDAASEEWFTGMRESLPGEVQVTEDWPAMLRRAGLAHSGTRTFLTDLTAPLPASAREHLHARFSRFHEQLDDRLDKEDHEVLAALLDPEAETGILQRPDAFYLAASTVHTGRASLDGASGAARPEGDALH